MNWPDDLLGWPHAEHSRRVPCAPHRWHAQEMGRGPLLLFLHGAGASTHSWAPVMADMAADHHVVAIDLPGHGFTTLGGHMRSGLAAMTEDIARLCAQEGWQPARIVAHSAGAAIALNLCRSHWPQTEVIAVNPALNDFEGAAGLLFPLLAKTLALNPLVPWLFSKAPNPMARARRLISGTGSELSGDRLALYARLLQDKDHVNGALAMMAQWSLRDLRAGFAALDTRCLCVLGLRDTAVPPRSTRAATASLRHAAYLDIPEHGHLLHEEDPARLVQILRGGLGPTG